MCEKFKRHEGDSQSAFLLWQAARAVMESPNGPITDEADREFSRLNNEATLSGRINQATLWI